MRRRNKKHEKPIWIKKDTTLTINIVNDTNGNAILLNGLLQGNNIYDRIGTKIHLNFLTIKAWLQYKPNRPIGIDSNYDLVHIAIVYDRQSNKSTPIWQNIFKGTDIDGNINNEAINFANPNNKSRFIIIKEKWLYLPPATTTGMATHSFMSLKKMGNKDTIFNEHIELHNLETNYNEGNTGNITDINTGSLIIIAKGLNNDSVETSWRIKGNIRLFAKDIF